jgi:hypothetical protein
MKGTAMSIATSGPECPHANKEDKIAGPDFDTSDRNHFAHISCAGAIIGALYSDWRNTVRLKLQQEFDAQKVRDDRRQALRVEVYLPAVEALIECRVR